MLRNIKALEEHHFDILIIGGGITGATIAWEASLRNYRVALIEKQDFGNATSMATSKLIHGGLRYLAEYDFSVVRDSLKERRTISSILSYQVKPLPFILPIYKNIGYPKFMMRLGLSMYDLLSYDKNMNLQEDKKLKNHTWISKEEALKQSPYLNPEGLQGAFLYYDVQCLHTERFNMDFISSAIQKGAIINNYVEALDFQCETKNTSHKITHVLAKDTINNKTINIHANMVINATGPWGDLVLSKIKKTESFVIKRSKGIHILYPKVNNLDCAITFETKEKKHFFILPWNNHTLIGTTDVSFSKSPDALDINQDEVKEFIELVTTYYPHPEFKYENILYTYAGLRPLVSSNNTSTNTYSLSRKYEIIDHAIKDDIINLTSVLGGKYTTSRQLAEDTLKHIEKKYELKTTKSVSSNTKLYGNQFDSNSPDWVELVRGLKKFHLTEECIQELTSRYGNYLHKIYHLVQKNKQLVSFIDSNYLFIYAEIDYAIEYESAYHLSDIMYRRCGLGNLGYKNMQILKKLANYIGKKLNWKKSQQLTEIESYLKLQKIHAN